MGRGEKSLPCDPGSELRLGGREKGRAKITTLTGILILKDVVSCEYDRWVVETLLCKLRDTFDTLIGLTCAMLHFVILRMAFVN